MKADDIIHQLKEKATEFARTHATQNAKNFYLLGKRDAISTVLAKVKEDGISAIEDIAKEMLRFNQDDQTAKWILENQTWKTI
jgi:hypothetical protein